MPSVRISAASSRPRRARVSSSRGVRWGSACAGTGSSWRPACRGVDPPAGPAAGNRLTLDGAVDRDVGIGSSLGWCSIRSYRRLPRRKSQQWWCKRCRPGVELPHTTPGRLGRYPPPGGRGRRIATPPETGPANVRPLRCRGPRSGWRRESPLPKQFEHSFDYCTRLHPTPDKIATSHGQVSYIRSIQRS